MDCKDKAHTHKKKSVVSFLRPKFLLQNEVCQATMQIEVAASAAVLPAFEREKKEAKKCLWVIYSNTAI